MILYLHACITDFIYYSPSAPLISCLSTCWMLYLVIALNTLQGTHIFITLVDTPNEDVSDKNILLQQVL